LEPVFAPATVCKNRLIGHSNLHLLRLLKRRYGFYYNPLPELYQITPEAGIVICSLVGFG
jgi:hypothetical protein